MEGKINMDYLAKVYEDIENFINNSSKPEAFNGIFTLICDLVDNLGNYNDESIKRVIKLISEYDFEKNRGQ